MSYKIIEKNEFGVRVRNYSEMSDCNLCKNVAEKNICNRIECAPNSYYLPDSEVERLEYEANLKAKNEELINYLEENTLCYETIVITFDNKEHIVFVPSNFNAKQQLDYYEQIFGKWISWEKIIKNQK